MNDLLDRWMRMQARRREDAVWRLCRRYLAALCPSDPYDLVSFLWTMGLELRGIIGPYDTPYRIRIYRGQEVLDEETA